MLRKLTTAAAVAVAFTSLSASAATITAKDIQSGNGTAGGYTFTPQGGQLSYKSLNQGFGVGVGDANSNGGLEISSDESITASATNADDFLFGGTTLLFLYTSDAGYSDAFDETAKLTATLAKGGSQTFYITRTGDSTVSVTDGSGNAVPNAPVGQVSGNGDNYSQHTDGMVQLGALFGDTPISSLIFTAKEDNPSVEGPGETCYPQGCPEYSDYAIGSIDVSSAPTTGSGTPVPEPASIAMFGLGLVLLGFGLRRRRDHLG